MDLLQKRLEIEFINEVNQTGVDINRALDFPHMAVLTQFLCGLGPRKAGHLLKVLIFFKFKLIVKEIIKLKNNKAITS